jgi:hypothetical protein
MSMARLTLVVALGAALALVTAAAADEGAPIRATRYFEERPIAGSGYLAWSQNSSKQPRLARVYARAGTGKAFLVSRRGQGYPGSITGTTLVYQEYLPSRRESSIRFYDLARKRHLVTPLGVNTGLWEWRPSLSGDWLLFSRNDGRSESVVLRNVRTRSQVELDRGRMPRDGNYGIAGQVNGNFAVWQRCPRGKPCSVVRYDIATRTKTPMPPPLGFVHYAPSVAPDGTTYLGRSEPGCGESVELWRYPLVGEPAGLFSLPAGRDFFNTYVEARSAPIGGANDVYYDRASCRGSASDLYRFTDRILPPPP